MPGSARKQFAGARYHGTNRGNGRLPLFYRPDDYERFLDQFREALARDGVVLYAYSLAMRASGYALGDDAFRREMEQWVRGQADEWAERSDVDVPALPQPASTRP